MSLRLTTLERLQWRSPGKRVGWSRAVESSTCCPNIKSLPLITEEQFWAPCFEQDWELHLRLTIPPVLGAAQELPGALVGHPDEVGLRSATKRTVQFIDGFCWIKSFQFWGIHA